MIRTRRRRNLCEAYIIVGQPWASIPDLQGAGAYGCRQSIHRAMRRMLEHHAVVIKPVRDGTLYASPAKGNHQ